MRHADPFDHFQRYESIRRIVQQIQSKTPDQTGQDALRVLEIGANSHFNLARFLPGATIVYSDLEAQPDSETELFVQADASQLPFATDSFDFVVSLDVFEHVPRSHRAPFIAECHRVASSTAIVACPVGLTETEAAEDVANETFRRLAGEGYRWLDEHKQEGLPSPDELQVTIAALNTPSTHFLHGRLRLWQTLMRLHFLKEFAPALREATGHFDRLYNESLYQRDIGPDSYRQFWIFGPGASLFDKDSIFDQTKDELPAKFTASLAHLIDGVEQTLLNDRSTLAEANNSHAQREQELQRQIKKLGGELASANQSIQQALEDEQQLRASFAAQVEQIKRDYEQSGSWRVTAPLRQMQTQKQNVSSLMQSGSAFVRSRGGIGGAIRSVSEHVRSDGFVTTVSRFRQLALSKSQTSEDTPDDYQEWLSDHNRTLNDEATRFVADHADPASLPLISIVMPTWNPEPEFLEAAIHSATGQIYPNWELCIADDASTDPAILPLLAKFSTLDKRIKYVARSANGHIVNATNSALELVNGQWVCFLDHDDLLHPAALAQVASRLIADPELDIVYTDEDKLSETGMHSHPFLKPDWSPHLGISQAYLGHLVSYRKEILDQLGGMRAGTDGAQDHDLWLRASLLARKIGHIPKILYHWRQHQSSTALRPDSKPYAHGAGLDAVQHHIAKKYPDCSVSVESGEATFTYRLRFDLPESTLVSIIIPTRDRIDLLLTCIKTIQDNSSWQQFEILIIDNQSVEKASHDYFASIQAEDSRIRVIAADIDFNWSRLNNLGAAQAKGDVLIFLNNDTEVLSPDWIEQLAGYAKLPDVGTVGGLLLYEDRTIQHSGVVVGMGGWADHIFKGVKPIHHNGPFVSPVLTRNVLAVTGACVAIEKSKFDRLGGFDEAFIICGSDVEICLRAHANNLQNIMCAQARLVHLESKTRTPAIPENDFQQSALKYEPYRKQGVDPYFNPNLSLSHTTPGLAPPGKSCVD